MNISVILTSYNPGEKIRAAVAAICDQTVSRNEYELIVVDDGSNEENLSLLHSLQKEFDFTFFPLEKNMGAAHARNFGVSKATSNLVALIQDDIIVANDFLEQHLSVHTAHNQKTTVVVGYTDWAETLPQTPFLEFLNNGQQFDYGRYQEAIDSNSVVLADYLLFYSSNLSMHRNFFNTNNGFNEDFRLPGIAAYDDTEFAWRLKKAGMQLYFQPAAKAEHDHLRTLESLSKRRFAEGVLLEMLYDLHPDFSWKNEKTPFWYNVKNLKFGAIFSEYRIILVILTTIVFNPVVVWPLRKIAEYLQHHKNVPLLFKIVLGYSYNMGYWHGFLRRRGIDEK